MPTALLVHFLDLPQHGLVPSLDLNQLLELLELVRVLLVVVCSLRKLLLLQVDHLVLLLLLVNHGLLDFVELFQVDFEGPER